MAEGAGLDQNTLHVCTKSSNNKLKISVKTKEVAWLEGPESLGLWSHKGPWGFTSSLL